MTLAHVVGKKFGTEITEEAIRKLTGANIVEIVSDNSATAGLGFVAGRVRLVTRGDRTITSMSHERRDGGFIRFSRGA